MRMNKTDLIQEMQSRGMTKAEAMKAIDITLDSVTSLLKKDREAGGSLALRGFGTFTVTNNPARTARNPRTGEPMTVEASRGVRFKSADALKQAVN